MKNTTDVENLIWNEYERSKRGKGYIENAGDASRFISHLMFLMTGAKVGEERQCLTDRLKD